MLKNFISLALSVIIIAFMAYFGCIDKEVLGEAREKLIIWGGFILILLLINLEPAPHPDTVTSAKNLPLWKRLKIYWAVVVAGITDFILIIFEFLGLGN